MFARLTAALAGVVLTCSASANEYALRWRAQGVPVIAQLDALLCPNQFRREQFITSMKAGGWQQSSWISEVTKGRHYLLVIWTRPPRDWESPIMAVSQHDVLAGTFCLQTHDRNENIEGPAIGGN